ncbi:cell division protein CrgA [Nesterenkonia sp. HG001]|uniref:cell division protein CrgA n=1 Tax=Nesterenkonia sp. HG001 TaxID=2983207 RepID=UPI002AC49938|nr:cell division protein CrgA [Nesterenkonia sp. HG001]MDZ5077401.1 cell division protein CrgA [Nesterenkonia sp. HG001]
MPESKNRKKSDKRSRKNRGRLTTEDAGASKSPLNDADPFAEDFDDLEDQGLPLWYRVTMIGLMILGLLWLIVWYISQGLAPIAAAGGWNVIIGFGIAMIGFFMTMRWR